MNKILYIDPISGISGDMFLAACVDLGVNPDTLKAKLQNLTLDSFQLNFNTVLKNGIRAISTDISIIERPMTTDADASSNGHVHRHLHHIQSIINSSSLSDNAKSIANKIFLIIAEAEAFIHNTTVEKVHFHEVGAMDSIIDIMGAAICIDELKVDTIICGHVPTGYGSVSCEHGVFPVPAPATLEILRDIPIKHKPIEAELTTPTGAAILKAITSAYSACIPDMKVTKIGYGAGNKDFAHPNVLRLLLGTIDTDYKHNNSLTNKKLVAIEATIDDMQPEFYQHIIDRMMAAGAKEAFFLPAIMKKDRTGTLLKALVDMDNLQQVKNIIFHETSTLGIRLWGVNREALERRYDKVIVRGHEISVKVGLLNNRVVNIAPEYEDCKRVALKTEAPIKLIYQEALKQI
ncbi:TIGR00299 family protein [Desulfuribacillus alkaliarsenatis]|uniref:Pyridinium-3,5-bisthiocarboxylic acid mononucleotide nickel insertion protein n=1 Tax=Desulfuribacillus alkaliarsenatis TaxID=766136 RepID=A0A1E5G3A9_9FIRM|nr:TIGR00299 family protein [Desulfuribacillus alkaliarsenatis]